MEECNKAIVLKKDEDISGGVFRKKEMILLSGILLLGASLIFLQRFMEAEMSRDSAYYLLLAEKWHIAGFEEVVEHLSGSFWFPPLHLYLVVVLTYTGISAETAALTIGMGCGILMPLISFAAARELFHDSRISLTAALLTAINPSIIEMSVQAQRDVPYLFAAGWCIFFIIAAIKRNKWYWWCFAGIPLAVSFLIRYETLEFLPLLGIYFLAALFKRERKWYLLIRDLAIFAVTGLAVSIILLYVTGTEGKMIDTYCNYFAEQFEYLKNLYDGGNQK